MSLSLETVGTGLIRRYIGRRFATLRVRAELTQVQAAKKVQLARNTIARIEDGAEGVRFREGDVRLLLDAYQADESESELLLGLTAETRSGRGRGWWHDYTESAVPGWFGLHMLLEDSAETIRQYHPELVPGLLQTREYTQLVMQTPSGYLTADEVQERVDVRMERQTLLARPRAPHLDVILNEAIIHRPIGSPDLRRNQLQHLVTAGDQLGISVRILPLDVGMHAGMGASAFNLLRFPSDPRGEPMEPPLVFVETLTGAAYLNKPSEIVAYEQVWADLEEKALGPAASRAAMVGAVEGAGDDD